MQITIRDIGNSKGVVLPKALLVQVGLADQAVAHVEVEGGAIVLRKPAKAVRAGWAEAAAALSFKGGDIPLMGEFGNAEDAGLVW